MPGTIILLAHGGLGPGVLAGGARPLLGDYFLTRHVAQGPSGEPERAAITIDAPLLCSQRNGQAEKHL